MQKAERDKLGEAREYSPHLGVPWGHGKNTGFLCKRNWGSLERFEQRGDLI